MVRSAKAGEDIGDVGIGGGVGSGSSNYRIVNGRMSEANGFPWQVAVVNIKKKVWGEFEKKLVPRNIFLS